jgi:hypothetical protein
VRAVVDTNVVAYFLLVDEARQFWQAVGEAIAPAVWEAELTNVVWMAIRKRVLPAEEGPKRLDLAGRLGIHPVQVGDSGMGPFPVPSNRDSPFTILCLWS